MPEQQYKTPVTLYEVSGARIELREASHNREFGERRAISHAEITMKSEIAKLKERQFYDYVFSDTPDGVTTLYHLEIYAKQVAEFTAGLTPRQLKTQRKTIKNMKDSYLNACDDYLVQTVDKTILAMRENEKNAE